MYPAFSERNTISEYRQGMADEEASMEVAFDISYDIADWLKYAAHIFHVRLLRDEHDMLWTTSKCMVLGRFAPLHGLDKSLDDDAYEDTKEQLKQILLWMQNGGVPDVPTFNVVCEQDML